MAQAGVPHQPGLYIGGLRHDLHPAKLATLIVSLLSKFQVQVAKRFVHITFKASEAFAIVELPDIKVSRNLLAQLSSTDNVLNVFDLSKITFHPSLPLPSRVSVTTSTPGAGNGLVTNFYRVGQAIGRETRHSEFKQGGRLKDRAWLIDTVGKYVCGFLNSAEGGTLYIGVSDKGVVTGISCPQSKEDDYRLLIDDALKGIDPPLFTHAYTVRFVPLMESSGHMSECLQVLEVEVKEIPSLDQLYVFRGNAYLRRDGSLQGPLKARQVQEWTRKRLEMDGTSGTLRWQLQLTTSQLEKEREKTARMEEKVSELEGYISELTQELARYEMSSPCSSKD
ncbi:uncharacterized protein LOC143291127 isoform X4 [Babylonia areolata]|uniref:uncharacterized protein LOC143291127 isoform X4 n=1 Tax=Babylonia areolata TaxID=304850 RepID=UPI003FD3AE8C